MRRRCPGLKHGTETAALHENARGRGALSGGRSRLVRGGGLLTSENVGMSSEKKGENPFHRKPKDS